MSIPYDDVNLEIEKRRKALEDEHSQYDTTGAIAGALASLGSAFQGKDSMAAANQVMQQRAQGRKDEVTALEKWKADKIAEIKGRQDATKFEQDQTKFARDEADYANETSLESEDSKMYQGLASKMVPGKDFSKMSAE